MTTDSSGYIQNIKGCFVGNVDAGYKKVLSDANGIRSKVVDEIKGDKYKLFSAASRQDDLFELNNVANYIRDNFEKVVILGMGGATLNPQAITALKKKSKPEILYADNIDPSRIAEILDNVDIKKTAFLSISKSGNTIETVAQTLTCLTELTNSGIDSDTIGNQFYFICGKGDNLLRQVAAKVNAKVLDHDEEIIGRFSTFTNVGLLPMLISGLDANAFRKGAANLIEEFTSGSNNYPLEGAAISYALSLENYNTTVVMPYVEQLSAFTSWFRQIWAECLGKDGKGTTPIKAIGTLDQHSQLQMYLDGPDNKMFTLIVDNNHLGKGRGFSAELLPKKLEYLANKTLGCINYASFSATKETLIAKNKPTRIIELNGKGGLDEQTLGELFAHFMLEVIIFANLIKVNPFNQPAVENGKKLTREYLSQDNFRELKNIIKDV